MDSIDLIFRSIAVLHGIAGYVLFGFAANEEVQQSCFYKGKNPLAGDFHKYLVYLACWSLVACSVSAFFVPWLAVLAAWVSVAFYLLTGFVGIVVTRRWPAFCTACAVSLGVRILAAVVLTGTLRLGLYG